MCTHLDVSRAPSRKRKGERAWNVFHQDFVKYEPFVIVTILISWVGPDVTLGSPAATVLPSGPLP